MVSDKAMPMMWHDILTPCLLCKHLREAGSQDFVGWRCEAFGSDDIPLEILQWTFDHRESWRPMQKGQPTTDNGVLFEDAPDAEYTLADLIGPLPPFGERLRDTNAALQAAGLWLDEDD